jgi:hypothetical protein
MIKYWKNLNEEDKIGFIIVSITMILLISLFTLAIL